MLSTKFGLSPYKNVMYNCFSPFCFSVWRTQPFASHWSRELWKSAEQEPRWRRVSVSVSLCPGQCNFGLN